jgi:peptide/nickel transport system substrate-binding protein
MTSKDQDLTTKEHNTISRRHALKLVVGASATFVFASPFRTASAQSLGGRDTTTLVVAVDAPVDNLDPATNVEWAYGLQPVYDTLLRLADNSTTEVSASLALEAVANDDSSIWTIKLRPGVKFHDGSACHATAVRDAIVRTILLPIGSGYVWNIEDPKAQISVVDATTLQFDMGGPRPLFNLELCSQYNYWIASPTAAAAHSEGEEDLGNAWLRANPVGTGPFVFESLDPGVEYSVKKNPDYWGGHAKGSFDRIITKTIPFAGTRRQLLERGEIDIMFPTPAEHMEALSKDDRFVVTDEPTMTMRYVALGQYGPLADPRARQALNHAFDNVSYVRDVQLNTHTLPTSTFPSLLETADTSVGIPEFDLAKASELFEAAGVVKGTELTYAYYTEFGNLVGELLQAWLGQIGIKLILQEKSFSGFIDEYFSDAPAEERPNMYFFSWWPNVSHPNDFAQTLFHSGSAGSLGGNAGFYANDEVDALIDGMFQVPLSDPELAIQSRRLQQILTNEDPAWIPVMEERTHMTYRKDIGGLEVSPLQVATLDMKKLRREV